VVKAPAGTSLIASAEAALAFLFREVLVVDASVAMVARTVLRRAQAA
jgi:hypothetical protein